MDTGYGRVKLAPNIQTYNFTESTNDGYIQGENTDYATARSTSLVYDTTTDFFRVGSLYPVDEKYFVIRGFLKFNTSGIPDSDIVTQVNLKMVCYVSEAYSDDFDIQIVKQDWSAWEADPTNATKRETAYDNCLSGTADDNIWRNSSGIVVNTQYASGNLNTTWINKIGDTYYSLRSSRDYGNLTPTGIENILIYSQNHTTVAYRPILTVTAISNNYSSSGTYTSPIIQRAQVASWGNISWTKTGTGTIAMRARSCTSASESSCQHYGDGWSYCGTINSGDGVKMASPNCVSDSDKFIQYQATLSGDTTATPYLEDVTLDYLYNPDTSIMSGTVKFFGTIFFK